MSAATRFAAKAEWFAAAGALVIAAAVARSMAPEVAAATAAGGALAALAVWIVWQDLHSFTVSDAAVLALAALGLAVRWSTAARAGAPASDALLAAGLDVILCGGLLLLFREGYYRLRGFDGLGLGDVKLGAAGAVLVGTTGFAVALFAASAAGLAFAGARHRLAPGRGPLERIAFGAALAPAFWVIWLVETTTSLLPAAGGGA